MAGGVAPVVSIAADEGEPRTIGRYLLGPELGSGGMAVVHLGAAAGALGFVRVVAIKRMHVHLSADASFRQALQDEARIVSRIHHPNVVAIVDVIAEHDDVALVLEYVHGESLASLFRRSEMGDRPLAIGVATSIAMDVLHGLHAAHRATDEHGAALDVVHRDVSPQNVIVATDGTARVLDFGVAKAQNRVSVTRDGAVKGKIGFMAPEQIGGEASAQSDLYAVGILLWEMLVGRSPFAASQTPGELLALALRGVDTAPGAHRPGVPPALDAVVMRSLASRPAERFRSASEMANALAALEVAAPRTEVAALLSERAELAARWEQVRALERRAASRQALAEAGPPREGAPATPAAAVALNAARSPRSRRWATVFAALTLGVVVLSGVQASRVRASTPVSSVARPAKAPPTDAPPAISASPVEIGSPSVPATGVPSAPVASASGTLPRSAGPPRAVRSPVTRAAEPDCTTPYVVDANGFRAYRRECFAR